ncbi:MAG: hypothetical protein JWR69_4572 [Pedosphaera sp.]|nr:hypothetical protein [Pedosphaera sp.]
MNKNNVWLNFAVKDLRKTREFYSKLDHFKINKDCPGGDNDLVSVIVGDDNLIVNFFPEAAFKGFINNKITDAGSTETCLSLGATSVKEVDARLKQAVDAGATVFAKADHMDGWMYGAGFADPDGHRWNFLYMDMAKMSK